MDYENTSAGATSVAFIKFPAAKQPALGDAITNPASPGGSGVNYVLSPHATLTSIMGTSYNLIGTDPRGVNNSGPNIDCFEEDPSLRDYYDGQYYSKYNPRRPISVKEHWTDAGGFGEWCGRTLSQDAKYANTPATAHDMLYHTELLAESQGKPRGKSKLDFFGVSYGSTLATTFAALWPERVGHMIIDGIVDVEDHYGGGWTQTILQADEAVAAFNKFCLEAGPTAPSSRTTPRPKKSGSALTPCSPIWTTTHLGH